MTATEYVVLVNERNEPVGRAEKLAAHEQNLLHRAFSVFILRQTQVLEILLQQRAAGKYHSPLLWTNTCCSHPREGEDTLTAGKRRLSEEMGLAGVELQDLGWFIYNAHFDNGLSEHELDHVLIGTVTDDHPFTPNPDEVANTRWVTLPALEADLNAHPEQYTPWLKEALALVRLHLNT